MARRTNITGISMLSIGTTKNDRGHTLTRYLVNDKKGHCTTFYFGAKNPQKNAFISAIQHMIKHKLYEYDIEKALLIYKEFKHDCLC